MNDAVANLTMFSKEAADDVREIKHKLEATSNELNERERQTRKQEALLKDIRSELAVSERKMESYEQKNKVLRDQAEAHASHDFSTQEAAVKRKIIEKETQIKRLMHKVQSQNSSQEKLVDTEVRKTLQKARRNVNLMQKLGPGLYQVKGRGQIVLVEAGADGAFTATFRPSNASSQ